MASEESLRLLIRDKLTGRLAVAHSSERLPRARCVACQQGGGGTQYLADLIHVPA